MKTKTILTSIITLFLCAAIYATPQETLDLQELKPEITQEIQQKGVSLPLIEATKDNNITLVMTLIKQGQSIDQKDSKGNTALIYAAAGDYTDIIDTLIKNGANVNIQNKYGATALIVAAYYGNRASVVTLANQGADLTIRNQYDNTALMEAYLQGHKDIVNIIERKYIEKLTEKTNQ